MSSTFPIPRNAASQIIDGGPMVRSEISSFPSGPVTTPFLWDGSRSCPHGGIDGPILLSEKNTTFAVLAMSPPKSTPFLAFFPIAVDNTQYVDRERLQEFISCQHQAIDVEEEWEDYGEPLFDPVGIEVDLMVMDYFRRADADLAKNE